jgi:hypothetical protein
MFLIKDHKELLVPIPTHVFIFLEENTKQIYLNVRQSSKIVNNYTYSICLRLLR